MWYWYDQNSKILYYSDINSTEDFIEAPNFTGEGLFAYGIDAIEIRPWNESVQVLISTLYRCCKGMENLQVCDLSGFNGMMNISTQQAWDGCYSLHTLILPDVVSFNTSANPAPAGGSICNGSGSQVQDKKLHVKGTLSRCNALRGLLSASGASPAAYTNYDLSLLSVSEDSLNLDSMCHSQTTLEKFSAPFNSVLSRTHSMFAYCSSLVSVDMHNCIFNNTYIDFMFRDCISLTDIFLPKLISLTDNIAYAPVRQPFAGAGNGDTLSVLVDFSEAQNCFRLFEGNPNYKTLRLKAYGVTGTTNINRLFSGLSNVEKIECNEDLFVENVTTNYSNTFTGCTLLEGENGSTFTQYGNSGIYAKLDGGIDDPGYFTKYVEPNRTDVEFITPDSGVGYVSEFGLSSDVRIEAAPGYTYVSSRIVDPTGEIVGETTDEFFPVIRSKPGVYIVYVTTKINDEESSENPGGGAYPNELNDPTDKLVSDLITDDKPRDWYNFGLNKFVTLYAPNIEQLESFGNYLWNPDIFSAVAKGISSILNVRLSDILVSLRAYPFAVPASTLVYPKIGWVLAAGCPQMNLAQKYYKEYNCGTIKVNPIYNSFLDYQVDAEIYLPYIGTYSLQTYDVIGKEINPIYQIDLITGECICKLFIDGSCKYQFNGKIGYEIPMAESNMQNTLSAGLNAAVMASGGISPKSITNKGETNIRINHSRKNPENVSSITNSGQRTERFTEHTAKELIGDFTNMHDPIQRTGAVTNVDGYLSIQYPYLMLTYPRAITPLGFGKFNGYPSNKLCKLSTISGYTEIEAIHLEGITATEPELEELDRILKGGVII